MASVSLPYYRGGQLRKSVVWRPLYTHSGEVPLVVTEYAEADVRWFGSGTVEVVMLELPIVARMPVACQRVGSRWRLLVSRWRECLMALKKVTTGGGSPATGGPGAEDAAAWPNLWEHLTATEYPGGEKRVTSSIIIVADANGWRGCLSDKDNSRTMWRTASTVEGLLLALEEGAASDDPAAWRAAGGGFKGRRKRP